MVALPPIKIVLLVCLDIFANKKNKKEEELDWL